MGPLGSSLGVYTKGFQNGHSQDTGSHRNSHWHWHCQLVPLSYVLHQNTGWCHGWEDWKSMVYRFCSANEMSNKFSVSWYSLAIVSSFSIFRCCSHYRISSRNQGDSNTVSNISLKSGAPAQLSGGANRPPNLPK